jgi:hypothetical protein
MTSSRTQLAVFALVLTGSAVLYARSSQVRLDDTFIYLRVARHVLEGVGPRFNPGDTHVPITGAGWLALLVTAKLLLPGVPLLALAKGLFIACLALASLALHALLAPRLPLASLVAPLPIFFTPWMQTSCGHDTALALGAGLGLLWSIDARRFALAPVFAAACYLARGEGAVFAALALAVALLRALRAGGERPINLRRLLLGSAAAATGVLAWHAWYASEFGALFPSTLAAKRLQGLGPWPSFTSLLGPHLLRILEPRWLAAFAIGGGLVLARTLPLLVAWPLVHYATLASLGVAYYFWYFFPIDFVVTLAVLVGLAGACELATRASSALRGPFARAALATLCVALSVAALAPARRAVSDARPGWTPRRDPLVAPSETRYAAYGEVADWIRSHPLREPSRPPTLLVDEIGLLGFFLPDARIVDVVGLAVPVESEARFFDWAHFARELEPDAIVRPWTQEVTEMLVSRRDGGWMSFARSFRPTVDYNGVSLFERQAREPHGAARPTGLLRASEEPLLTSQPMILEKRKGIGWILFAHARSELSHPVPPHARRLELGFGFLDGALAGSTDGARFEVFALHPDGSRRSLWSRVLRPREAEADRGPQRAKVALPGAGVEKLLLSIDPLEHAAWDWTYWSRIALRGAPAERVPPTGARSGLSGAATTPRPRSRRAGSPRGRGRRADPRAGSGR